MEIIDDNESLEYTHEEHIPNPEKTYYFEFNGNGGDYFKIWLLNKVLTIDNEAPIMDSPVKLSLIVPLIV